MHTETQHKTVLLSWLISVETKFLFLQNNFLFFWSWMSVLNDYITLCTFLRKLPTSIPPSFHTLWWDIVDAAASSSVRFWLLDAPAPVTELSLHFIAASPSYIIKSLSALGYSSWEARPTIHQIGYVIPSYFNILWPCFQCHILAVGDSALPAQGHHFLLGRKKFRISTQSALPSPNWQCGCTEHFF